MMNTLTYIYIYSTERNGGAYNWRKFTINLN